MVPRYGFSIGIALAVTFGLLFIMQLLIASGERETESRRYVDWVDFVRVIRDPVPDAKRLRPEKPPEPTEPPTPPQMTTGELTGATLTVSVTAPEISDAVGLGALARGISDGEYLPLAKVSPTYPTRAAQAGIEGQVIVEYTVTALGTTRDLRVVESSNQIFDRSCMDAAAKFKYRPRYIGGEAIETQGVRNRCVYRLDE